MHFTLTARYLNGIEVFDVATYEDDRGSFSVNYNQREFAQLGIVENFVQDNESTSKRGVIRGLHAQLSPPMGKLLWVISGEIQLVELDIRPNSPTYGQWIELLLSSAKPQLVWIPAGFANGFCVLSEVATVHYKCTAEWNQESEIAIRWDDPELAIPWRVSKPVLSQRDAEAVTFRSQSS